MMRGYQCPDCGYVYDEQQGEPHEGYAAGTHWADLPESFTCPDCAVREKADFIELSEQSS